MPSINISILPNLPRSSACWPIRSHRVSAHLHTLAAMHLTGVVLVCRLSTGFFSFFFVQIISPCRLFGFGWTAVDFIGRWSMDLSFDMASVWNAASTRPAWWTVSNPFMMDSMLDSIKIMGKTSRPKCYFNRETRDGQIAIPMIWFLSISQFPFQHIICYLPPSIKRRWFSVGVSMLLDLSQRRLTGSIRIRWGEAIEFSMANTPICGIRFHVCDAQVEKMAHVK